MYSKLDNRFFPRQWDLGVRRAAIAVVSVLFMLGPARADTVDECNKAFGQSSIDACTELLDTGKVRGKSFDKKQRANIYVLRGRARRSVFDWEGTFADYTAAIELQPNLLNAYLLRGDAYLSSDWIDKGYADMNAAVRIAPNEPITYFFRAKALELKADAAGALNDLNRAIVLNPKFAAAFHSRGELHLRAKRWPDAVPDLEKAVALEAGNGRFHRTLGEAYYYLGERDRALTVWRKACAVASAKTVDYWQRLFRGFGYYSGKVDGICGKGTIIAMQQCAEDKCSLFTRLIRIRE